MSSKLLRPAPRRHAVRKSFSYRYVTPEAVGPDGSVLRAGATIVETRYRGRAATWQIQLASGETWEVSGSFVEPRADNPLAYPEHALPAPSSDPGAGVVAPDLPVPSAESFAAPAPQAGVEVSTPLPQPSAAKVPPPVARSRSRRDSGRVMTDSAGDRALREFHRALLGSGSFDPVVS